MKNFIVGHFLNGALLSRQHFGESFGDALEFALSLKDKSHDVGIHDVIVIEEFTGEVKSLVSYRVIKTDDGVTLKTVPIVKPFGGAK